MKYISAGACSTYLWNIIQYTYVYVPRPYKDGAFENLDTEAREESNKSW